MGAVIKVNGVEVPEALCVTDTANNIVTLETMFSGEVKLNMNKIYVEVNIFGDIDL